MSVRSRFLIPCAIACAVAACDGGSSTQVITGRIDTTKGALAIRAISEGQIVTATPVRTDGSFTLALPAGTDYRLEVLTRTGVKNIVMRSGNVLRDLSFKVCQPVDPFDVGGVGDPNTEGLCTPGDANCEPCDPMTGTMCEQPPACSDPNDPDCKCEPQADGSCCVPGDPNCAPPCDPTDPNCESMCPDPTDPYCGFPPPCEPGDPNCCDVVLPDGTCCSSSDPSCGTSCQPGDPNCPPPSCDPTIDPMCKCNEDGTCPPLPCSDPTDPNCGGDCWADGTCPCMDPNAPGCVPPCTDPMDPTTCKDPCIDDPMVCGCTTPDCWPEPQPCYDVNGTNEPDTMCEPSDGMAPDNVPGDFGCEGM